MIKIRPIREDEIQPAKRMILKVAYGIFGWDGTLEESIRRFESSGELDDLDNVHTEYFDRGGIFLVILDDERLVGSGGIRKIDAQTAELKRMWLLETYHGKGVGFALMRRLLDFASRQGYLAVRLQTSPLQKRALDFYRRVGFHEIPSYNDETREISMELTLSGTNPFEDSSFSQHKELP